MSYVIRRQAQPRRNICVEKGDTPKPKAPPAQPREGWNERTIADEVRGLFRSVGARVFNGDPIVECRGERRAS